MWPWSRAASSGAFPARGALLLVLRVCACFARAASSSHLRPLPAKGLSSHRHFDRNYRTSPRHGLPTTITIDGSDAKEAAIKRYNEEHGTAIAIRQVQYLNNIVEQDHRGVKRVTRPMLGFKSFAAAQDTLVGIEFMHMLKQRQLVVEAGDEGRTATELFYALAA